MARRRKKNKRTRKKLSGIVFNVKVNRARKFKKFFSSSFFKKSVLLVCFSSMAVFGTILLTLGLEAFFKDPRYKINTISIYHQNFFKKEEILAMSGLTPGMYWCDFSVKKAAKEIEKNPNVKKAQIDLELPHRVIIKVIERQPVVVIKGRRKNFLLDLDGVVLPMRSKVDSSLPTLIGCRVLEEQIGQKIDSKNILRSLSLIQTFDELNLPLGLEIVKINAGNVDKLVVYTRSSIRLLFGSGNFSKKIVQLLPIVEDLKSRGEEVRTVDLRFKDIVVRPYAAKGKRSKKKENSNYSMPVVRVQRR